MSYFRKQALSGVSTTFPVHRRSRVPYGTLGSLGDDTTGATSITTPTIGPDPATLQWQANVLGQLQAGVATLQKAELQKWLQIIATVSIPLSAAIWKMIFKRGVPDSGV